jgi:hypothetical protein
MERPICADDKRALALRWMRQHQPTYIQFGYSRLAWVDLVIQPATLYKS